MRPPSYYTSIAQGNDRNRSSYLTDVSATSQHLRTSFTSAPSSSYVNRSHLPFVPQSTLVAHCFTGVGSSTRPYGGSATSSLRSSSNGSSSSSSASSYLSTRTPSVHSSSNRYLSPSRPVSKRSPIPYSGSSAYSSSSSYLSTRSPYLSSSSSNSITSTSRYRPTTTTSSLSSYYKPIRLRERPILTQISNRLSATTLTTARKPADQSENEVIEPKSTGIKENKSSNNDDDDDDEKGWSQDVARNISRNKYLIKFREIDKPNRTNRLLSTENSELDISSKVDAQDVKISEQERYLGKEETPSGPAVKLAQSEEKSNRIAPKMCVAVEDRKETAKDNENCDTICTKKKVKKVKKRNSVVKLEESEPAEKVPLCEAEPQTSKVEQVVKLDQQTSEPATSDQAVVKKRNVKLKLRPIGPKKQGEAKQQEVSHQTGEKTSPNEETKVKVKRLVKKSSDPKCNLGEKTKAEESKKTIADNKENIADAKVALTKRKASDGKLKVDTQLASLARQQASSTCSDTSQSNKSARIRFRDYHYDDFNFLTVLGHGGWGFVILAELKEYDACFAVKCIKKITIVEDDDYDSIMIERKVLALGNINPFICKLFCTFETDGYLFFVMEYCAGGDLMFHVQHEGKFTESRSRFYAAEIICAMRFLHNRHIIYRDLKLDNILLDSRGHIRLVDFGMCQCRTYREEMLPSNFCGTPEYISPEIIKGVPYNHSVDWWSFGVLLYEMAVGKMPFRGNDENELLWNVCYEQIHYPMFLSKELTDLLKLLLEREPSKRMGMATCKSGDIYDQPFFRGVNWKAVEELKVEPPFVPEVTSKRDVQNFDSDFTESACELSPVDEKTLARIDQRQFEKFPYTNPDIFMFEQPQ